MSHLSMKVSIKLSLTVGLLLGLFACSKSPEDLPKFKKRFRAQIASFESQKSDANNRIDDGVESLNSIQQALEGAKKVDQVFQKVYGKWERVDKDVNSLFKEYEKLKTDADNLFSAMERQTQSLNNQTTRNELTKAISTYRKDYEKTLAKTSLAIEKLRALHTDAVDNVKALEVAVALGQVSQFTEGLVSIEQRVDGIMADLTETIKESKDLYDQKIDNL